MAIDLSMFYTVDEQGNQVELTRPETKSKDDVLQCIEHNKGQPVPVIDRFIEMAGLGEQWDWFDAYKGWQAECLRITELNAALVPDEETGELPEPYPLPVMPERPALIDIAQWKLHNYQILREAAYLPTEEQDDLRYWDKINGTDKWNAHRAEIKALWPKG